MSPRRLASGLYLPFDTGLTTIDGLVSNDVGVDVSTIRKFGAKFGRGVAVENGVTNLTSLSDFTTLLGNYNATDGFSSTGVINGTDGWRRVPKLGPTLAATEIFCNAAPAMTVGQRCTIHIMARASGTIPTASLFFIGSGGSVGASGVTMTALGNGIYRFSAHGLAGAGVTQSRWSLSISNWQNSTYIEFQEPMYFIHSGSILTITEPVYLSHVWGTRAVGVLKYPGYLLPRDQGTVACWVRPNYNYHLFENNWRDIVRSATTVANDEFRFTIGANAGASGHLQCRFWAATVNTVALDYSTPVWDPAVLHHVALTWSNVETVLYYNGVRRATFTGNFARWAQAPWINVGGNNTPTEQIDGLIDDLTILPRQLTDAQIAAVYA